MKGILTRWECPSCGTIMRVQDVIVSNVSGSKNTFGGPTKCACGRTGKFRLMSFEPLEVGFAKENTELINVPSEISNEVSEFAYNKVKELQNKLAIEVKEE